MLYEPQNVAVALEVKKSGCYGKGGRKKVKKDFARLRELGVKCAYVTFEDRKSYCYRPTKKWLGFPCFALAWHKGSDNSVVPVKKGENWEAFVSYLRAAVGR